MQKKENKHFLASLSQSKKTYMRYTRDMRIRLIKFVDEDGLSTAQAARIVGIKQTSACRIMKSYHVNRTIFERRNERIEREGAALTSGEASSTLLEKRMVVSKREGLREKSDGEAVLEKDLQGVITTEKEKVDGGSIEGVVNPSMQPGFLLPPFLNLNLNYYPYFFQGAWSFPVPFCP